MSLSALDTLRALAADEIVRLPATRDTDALVSEVCSAVPAGDGGPRSFTTDVTTATAAMQATGERWYVRRLTPILYEAGVGEWLATAATPALAASRAVLLRAKRVAGEPKTAAKEVGGYG